MNDMYMQVFIDKCAAYGVDPEQLLKAASTNTVDAAGAQRPKQLPLPQRLPPPSRPPFLRRPSIVDNRKVMGTRTNAPVNISGPVGKAKPPTAANVAKKD